jgi:heme/copper-type cytochrome/quinol oxidase subunit 3
MSKTKRTASKPDGDCALDVPPQEARDSHVNAKIVLRWIVVVVLLVAAWVFQAKFSVAVSAAMALPYDAPAKQHDSLVAAVEVTAAVLLVFSGVILALFNIHWHRRARKTA